jgi:pyrroloquinoline quinone biosynthesis protein D
MALVDPHAVFALSENASIQSVGDGAVVLLADSGQLYTCNATTEAFVQKIDGRRSFDDIVALFGEEFDVDEATARQDLAELVQTLLDEDFLRRV